MSKPCTAALTHDITILQWWRRAGRETAAANMLECRPNTNLQEAISIFAGIGYRVFELGTIGPVAVTSRIESPQDLFACPLERMPARRVASPSS